MEITPGSTPFMRYTLLLLIISLGFMPLWADPPTEDLADLIERANSPELMDKPEELVVLYSDISKRFYGQRQWDLALDWTLKGLDLAEANGLEEDQFFFSHMGGSIFYYPNDQYEESDAYLKRARMLADTLSLSGPYVVRNLNKLVEVSNARGDISKALEYQLLANDRARVEKDSLGMAMGFRNLGVIYWGQDQFSQALKNFLHAHEILERCDFSKITDPVLLWDKSLTLYNVVASIGGVHISLGNMSAALVYTREAQAIADSIGHPYGVAYAEGLNARILAYDGRLNEALVSTEHAVEIYKQMGLKREWTSFSVNVADLLITLGKPNRALQVLDRTEPVARDINSPSLMRDIYYLQSQVLEELGNIETAFQQYKRYVQLNDSLRSEDQISALARMEPLQEVEESKARIKDLQEENESSRRKFGIVIFFSSLILMLGLLYLVYHRNRTLRNVNKVLAKKNEEIKRQNERLASSNDDLRQFAHVVSHDLREPLRSIGSFATLLQRRYAGKIDHDADEFIHFITAGVKRMDTLLADLMAYSVVGIFNQELRQVDTNAVIQGIIESITRDRGNPGARIQISNLPTIIANPRQIQQLFQHLVDNAIKFRSEAPPEIRIEATKQGSYYLFSVRDNGIGMDEAYKDKIFGVFLRLHTKKSKYKGTGIGLSICKKIVEQHKGKIWIDSELGIGTTVFFTLPEKPMEEIDISPRLIED